ncbi:MAG: hypothetical protein RR540_01415 [Oscillospiraceae bacterium]
MPLKAVGFFRRCERQGFERERSMGSPPKAEWDFRTAVRPTLATPQ